MARLPALIETLGRHHPRGAVGVENYARILRKAGKITPSKRGVGAADVTVSDASNLLFGLSEMNNAQYAPVAVDMFRGALLVWEGEGEPDPIVAISEYQMSLKFNSLGELMDSIFIQLATNPQPSKRQGVGFVRSIDVRMSDPDIFGASAFITFSVEPRRKLVLQYHAEHPEGFSYTPSANAGVDGLVAALIAAADHPQGHAAGGISFDINISYPVLIAVAKCVSPKPQES